MVARERLVEACALDQLLTEQALLVRLGHHEVGLLLHQGRPVAIVNDCPHFGGPLAQGPLSTARGEIICPWHKFRFDLATGQSVTNPALVALVLPTAVRDGKVFVDVSKLDGGEG
jgi:nitrite reductase/ring-hydroxylating ferredoxin subunit